MSSRRIAVVIFSGLALVAGSQILRSAPGVDVQTLQENWRLALVAANVDALNTIFSDGLVYVHSDGRIQNKEQFLAPIKAGTLRFTSLTACDAPRIRAYDAAAIVSACYELRVGTGPPSRHLFLNVYANEGGQWRIVAQQTTRLPEKQ
jgi:hypothetical protein